jgi:hypothetical protein
VEGVTVQVPVPQIAPSIPDDERARFDAEVARQAAFREYRESRPGLTYDNHGVGDPNDLAADFPGLQAYLPN